MKEWPLSPKHALLTMVCSVKNDMFIYSLYHFIEWKVSFRNEYETMLVRERISHSLLVSGPCSPAKAPVPVLVLNVSVCARFKTRFHGGIFLKYLVLIVFLCWLRAISNILSAFVITHQTNPGVHPHWTKRLSHTETSQTYSWIILLPSHQ